MKRRLALISLAVAAVAALSIGLLGVVAAGDDDDNGNFKYEVTITNLTRGQIFSPPVVFTHNSRYGPLFTAGSPASSELAEIAEDAVNQPLVDALEADSNVKDIGTVLGAMGVIKPGETASGVVEASRRFRLISLAGMAVTTNDAFYALNGVSGPRGHRTAVYMSPAWDSGSEANNEDCDFIPGPPCGNPGVRDTDDAEGYVHINAGIHGIADLVPADHDWRNPVARITSTRMNGDHDDEDEDDA